MRSGVSLKSLVFIFGCLSTALAFDTVSVLGVYDGNLGRVFREEVRTSLRQRFVDDSSFAILELPLHLRTRLENHYPGQADSGKIAVQALSQVAPTTRGLFLVFQQHPGFLLCNPRVVEVNSGVIHRLDTIRFESQVIFQPQAVVDRVINSYRHFFGHSNALISKACLQALENPIAGISGVYRGELLQSDRVDHLFCGLTLVNPSDGSLVPLSFQGGEVALYPGSRLQYVSENVFLVERGGIGFLNRSDSIVLFTQQWQGSGKGLFFVRQFSNHSEVETVSGHLRARTLLGESRVMDIPERSHASTNGYQFTVDSLPEALYATRVGGLQSIWQETMKTLISEKEPKRQPVRASVNIFQGANPDKMTEYAIEGLSEIGIDPSAMQLMGESWLEDRTRKPRMIHENGCYRCRPHHVGP